MSYNIIRSIRIDDVNKKVIISAASNNVTPRYYTTEEAPYFARIWVENGKEAVEIELVKAFESGNFQGSSSKYKEAAERLRKMPEYKAFNWRSGELGDEYTAIAERRREQVAEFDALVLKALRAEKPKTKFVIAKKVLTGQTVYFYHRANAGFCRWFTTVTKAKVFTSQEDAQNMMRVFESSNDWEVLQIA